MEFIAFAGDHERADVAGFERRFDAFPDHRRRRVGVDIEGHQGPDHLVVPARTFFYARFLFILCIFYKTYLICRYYHSNVRVANVAGQREETESRFYQKCQQQKYS